MSEVQWDGTVEGAPDGLCVHQDTETGAVLAAHLDTGFMGQRTWVKPGDWIVTDAQGRHSVRRGQGPEDSA